MLDLARAPAWHRLLGRAEVAAASVYGPNARRALGDLQAMMPRLLTAFSSARSREPAAAARLALAMGDLALFGGSLDPRSAVFLEALRAADESGNAELRVRTRVLKARVVLEAGAVAESERLSTEAVALADASGLADAAADARRALGWARLAAAQVQGARVVLEEALRRHREVGSVRGEADALAACGLVDCLEGNTEQGHRRLEVAHALHRGAGDALRRARVVQMARLVGLDLGEQLAEGAPVSEERRALRVTAAAHREAGRLWREALDLVRLAQLEEQPAVRSELLDAARRAAEEAGVPGALSSALARSCAGSALGEPPERGQWQIGPQARWLRAPDGSVRELGRRGATRRVLDALVSRRLEEPGAAVTADALFEVGWSGEKARYASAMLRVYTTIRRLRELGLEGVLLTRDDGYLIDPAVSFVRSASHRGNGSFAE